MNVNLDRNEWNTVLALLSEHPWKQVNTILMKIGSQVQMEMREHAAPGISQRTHSRAESSRLEAEVASANSSDSSEQRTTQWSDK